MDFRGSLSRLKKKFKHPLTGGGRKSDRIGAGARGETVEPAGSLPRPEHNKASGSNADGGPAQPGESDPAPVSGGGDTSGAEEADTDGRDAGQGYSPNEGIKAGPAINENKSDRESTTSTMAGLLRGVRDSAKGFGPLRSVAGGLCLILENCEVPSLSWIQCTMLTVIPAIRCG